MEDDKDSNHSGDLFSDDEDNPDKFLQKNFNLSYGKDALTDDDYVPSPEIKIEAPLSLLPFLSNTPKVWSKDMETPVKNDEENVTFQTIPRTPTDVDGFKSPITTKNRIVLAGLSSPGTKCVETSSVSHGVRKTVSGRRLLSPESSDNVKDFKPEPCDDSHDADIKPEKLDERLTSQDIFSLLADNNHPECKSINAMEFPNDLEDNNTNRNILDVSKLMEDDDIEKESEKDQKVESLVDIVKQLKQKKRTKPQVDFDSSITDEDFVRNYKLMEKIVVRDEKESKVPSPPPPEYIPTPSSIPDRVEVDNSQSSLYFPSLQIDEKEIDEICDQDSEENSFKGFTREMIDESYHYVSEWHRKFFKFFSFKGFTTDEIETRRETYYKHKKFYEDFLNDQYPLGNKRKKSIKRNENSILPPVIISVDSGFTTACEKEIRINLDSNYRSQLFLLDHANELDIDLLIDKADDKQNDENRMVDCQSALSSVSFWDDNSQPKSSGATLSGSVSDELCQNCLKISKTTNCSQPIVFDTIPEENEENISTVNQDEMDQIMQDAPSNDEPEESLPGGEDKFISDVVNEPEESLLGGEDKFISDVADEPEESLPGGEDKFISDVVDEPEKSSDEMKTSVDEGKVMEIDIETKISDKENDKNELNDDLPQVSPPVKNIFADEDFQDIPKMNPGFTTAGGKNLFISSKALSLANKNYNEIKVSANELDDLQEKNSRFKRPNILRKPLVSPLKGKTINNIKSPFKNLKNVDVFDNNNFMTMNAPKNTFAGFQTGSGKALPSISEDAMLKAKLAYDEVTKEVNKNCNSSVNKSEPIESTTFINETDKANVQSENPVSEESTEVVKKRKYPEDDPEDTPVGCKRARLGPELQRRKLFSEIEDEDRALEEASMYLDPGLDDINDTIKKKEIKTSESPASKSLCDSEPKTKSSLSDEIEASALALFEDENQPENEWSNFLAKSNSRNSLPEKFYQQEKMLTKRAKSLPDNLELNEPTVTSKSSSKVSSPIHESIPDDIIFDTQFSLENIFPDNEKRLEAISNQEEEIKSKRNKKIKPIAGSLWSYKSSNQKITLREFAEGTAPSLREGIEVNDPGDSCQIALSYQFQCDLIYDRKDLDEGVDVGDGAKLIPDLRNKAGVNEFKRSFLASPGVDPSLIPEGWVENHYKWIIWKLASLDHLKFGDKCLPTSLTPDMVMKQLKYRYDREIDRSERPALRRILEKDDPPKRRMILCVSRILITQEDFNSFKTNSGLIELTDGWYSILTIVDGAMVNLVKMKKVKEGTKLMIYGAELLNHSEGCHPLEVPGDVRLKISTNSTRRARWDAKLGYQRQWGPMSISLKSVKVKGGMISKLTVLVARIYPICYREKMPNGDVICRNAKSEEKVSSVYENERQMMMNKMYNKKNKSEVTDNLPIRRDVTPFGKIRIVDGNHHALLSLWTCPDEAYLILKENMVITVSNVYVSHNRQNVLILSTNKYTTFGETKRNITISYPKRTFTSIESIHQPKFNPPYSEFDTVGLIVSKGPAPHGMTNFETVNLAYKNSPDSETFYLSILFWQGISSYGYAETLAVGSFIACRNLQRRTETFKSIPTSYCTEDTILTQYPKQDYLKCELDLFKNRINDVSSYVDECATAIDEKILSATPQTYNNNSNFLSTPASLKKNRIVSRLEKLQAYNEPSALPTITLTSNYVETEFKPVRLTPNVSK